MDCVMGNEYACEAELADSDGRSKKAFLTLGYFYASPATVATV